MDCGLAGSKDTHWKYFTDGMLCSLPTQERGTVIKQDGGRYKIWSLDSGLDYGLDYGLNFGLDWAVDSVLAIKQTMNGDCPLNGGMA